MGIVVPTEKLVAILELPEMEAMREEIRKRREQETAAKPDSL
jgi:hypothetical protein